MKQLITLWILVLLCSCSFYDRKQEVLMTDDDFVEFGRELSPDGSMLLLTYGIDLGALGYGRAGTAILKLNDTTKNLRQYTLPNTLTRLKWVNNQMVSAKVEIIPFIRSGTPIEAMDMDTRMNGIKVRVSPYDYIEPSYHMEVEHRETSPNGKYELVAYRYLKDRSGLNFIHVSVIPKGGQIPKYGNYLIADMQSDYVLNGTWAKDNSLVFYSNDLYTDMVQYYLVRKRPDIDYKVVTDEKTYGNKYRWIGQHIR